MRWVYMLVTALHVLAGVFWAGSSFVVAHGVVARVERLAYSQAGAALVAILAGGGLFGLIHPLGAPELVLDAGALCAVVAATVQGTALPAIRQLRRANEADAAALRSWVLTSQRIGAALLAVTVVCMVVWRYA